MNPNELKAYLFQNIPITKSLDLNILEASLEKVRLSAPFKTHKNHKNTAFGGSLNTLLTLSCWVLLHLNLPGHQIVITENKTDYLTPVTSDFEAVSTLPPKETWEKFLNTLKRHKKGRLQLKATIHQGGTLAVAFTGTFAAFPHE